MSGSSIVARIDEWLAAGLIDAQTAERLRAAEAEHAPDSGFPAAVAPSSRGNIGDWFRFSAVEFFTYIGIGFLVAAYYYAVTREGPDDLVLGLAVALAAGVFLVAGLGMRGRAGAVGRAAGPALLVGGIQVPFAIYLVLASAALAEEPQLAAATIGWLAVALVARWVLASLPTQAGWLVAAAAAGWFSALYLGSLIFGPSLDFEQPDPVRQLLMAGWMSGVAVIIGLAGQLEARTASTDPGAGRRAALTRFTAGMTALVGLSAALLIEPIVNGGASLEPIVGQAILLAAAGVMVLASMRTNATAYLLPGGLAVIIALTSFNATYLTEEIGFGGALLIEGIVLLGVGVGVQVLRSRMLVHRMASGAHAGA